MGMWLRANFTIIEDTEKYLLIRDDANETQTMTITNDAESVVEYIHDRYNLNKNKILYYIDTDGRIDILEHDGQGKFLGFKFGYNNLSEFKNVNP